MSRVVVRGRSAELTAILRAVRGATRTGCAEMVVLTGKPGIGKSALLRAAVEQASRAGAAVGVGRADEFDQVVSGAPLLLALRSGPRPLLDSTAFAELESLYDRQLWLIERICALLEDAAARRPVVIAIDDVHWADPLTRLALRILPGRLAASPVIWVLTSRTSPATVAGELITAAEDLLTVTRLTLDRLSPADIDDLARDRLGEPPDGATRDLLRGAGGSPFWAVQLLNGLAWRRLNGLPPDNMHAELIDDVRQRLLGMAPEAAALVRCAAVWGRTLPLATAARLLGDRPVAQIIRAAREAADNGLLGGGETGVEFAHVLVRDAVYADIAPTARTDLHRTCARHLLGTEPTALAAAAHLRAIATRGDEEVVDGLVQAAEDSAATMPDQAAELAQEAFALMPEDHARWAATGQRVLLLLARVQREGAVLAIADRLIARTGDHDTSAGLQVRACRALWAIGRYGDIERRADLALRLTGVSVDVRAQLAAVRALASTRTASAPTAAAAAGTALTEGRRLGDELAQRMALLAMAEAARNEGRQQLVMDRFTDLRAISRSEYLAEEIRTLQHLDRYDDAGALLADIRAEAHDNVDQVLPSFLFAQVWQDHNLGRFDAAEAGARTLLRLAWEIGNVDHEINARTVLAGVAIYRGDLAAARAFVRPADAGDARGALLAARIRLVRGWLTGEEGDHATSLAILRPLVLEALSGVQAWAWSPPWMRSFAGLGLAAGDAEFTRATVRIAEMGARRNPGVATMVGTALQVRGVVDGDADVLAQAVAVLRRAPRPLLLAQALADHATVLRGAGDAVAAEARTAEATAMFDEMGVVPGALGGTVVREMLAARRKRTGSALRRPAHGLDALTETERRVADLTAAGHSSRSAAIELGVSPNTINTHLRSVFTKLKVRSRVQLSNLLRVDPADHAQPSQPVSIPDFVSPG